MFGTSVINAMCACKWIANKRLGYADKHRCFSFLLSLRQQGESPSSTAVCSHPVLVIPDHTQGGAEWSSGSHPSTSAPSFLATANLTSFSLAPCLDHGGAGGACRYVHLLKNRTDLTESHLLILTLCSLSQSQGHPSAGPWLCLHAQLAA